MTRNVKTTGAALARTDRPVKMETTMPKRTVSDGLENVVAGLGTSRDKMSYSVYTPPRTLGRQELENMFRTSWLAKRIVNAVAEDMTREWRTVYFDAKDNDQQLAIERLEARLGLRDKVKEAIMWSRLYGGSLIIIGTKDEDMSQPLNINTVGQDGLEWLQVVDRHRVSPSSTITTDLASPNFGLPDHYMLAESSVRVHHTRCLRFNGQKLPYFAWLQNAMWDDSELQHVLDSLTSCDTTTRGIATMVFEANVDVIKVDDLNELIGQKGGEAKVIKRFQTAAMLKSFNRTLLLSGGEEYDKKSNTFSNLDKILLTFMQDVCGAADIPMTRLFGQSAGGMNATGDGEIRNYYDMLKARQGSTLAPQLEYLDQILVRSALGNMPDDYRSEFNSLWQQSDKEVADTELARAQRDQIYLQNGVVPGEAVARDLKENNTYKNLTDEHIDSVAELDQPMDETGQVGKIPGTAAEPGAVPGEPVTTGEPLAATALNGAQVTAAQSIVVAVANKELPRESGVAMLQAFFQLSPKAAEMIMGSVGTTFFVDKPEPIESTAAVPGAAQPGKPINKEEE
jgi:phage-related protein (TIGR01555 family)